MGFGSILRTIGGIAGAVAAPFTGGASLALTAAGLGADIAGGILENRAINSATRQQTGSIDQAREQILAGQRAAIEENRLAALNAQGAADQVRARALPFETAGMDALFSLQSALQNPDPTFQFDQSKIQQDPSFDFIMQQAMKGLSRSAAGRMRLRSGDTQKELLRYASGLASTEYGKAEERQYRYQRDAHQSMIDNAARRREGLFGLTGIGRDAASEVNQAGMSAAQMGLQAAGNIGDIQMRGAGTLGDLAMTRGDVLASGTLAGTRSTVGAIDRIAEGVGQYLTLRGSRRQQPEEFSY